MPQLDPTSFPSQLFWLTVSFITLYVLLARFLMPRIQSVLSFRAATIEGDIAEASRMKTEAEAAQASYEKALAAARSRSDEMLAKARAELQARAAEQQHSLSQDIDRRLAASDASIRSAKQDVLAKLSPASGDLAALIVEVLVHHKPSPKEIGAAISGIKERVA